MWNRSDKRNATLIGEKQDLEEERDRKQDEVEAVRQTTL